MPRTYSETTLCSRQTLIVSAVRREDIPKAAYFAFVPSFIFLCQLALRQAQEGEAVWVEENGEAGPGGRVQGAEKLVTK